MKRLLLAVLMVCAISLTIGEKANALVTTLDFEDLVGSGGLDVNYHDLTWDSSWQYYDWAQSPYNPSSGKSRIYTHKYGGWIDFGQDVTFLGSWVASYNYGQTMYWEGYNDGVKIYESIHLFGGVQQFIDVFWDNVDYVKFVSSSFNHFIIDDIKYDSAPVPEPATLLLLGAGLTGLAFQRSRKKA